MHLARHSDASDAFRITYRAAIMQAVRVEERRGRDRPDDRTDRMASL
jgi:hypothetical protein